MTFDRNHADVVLIVDDVPDNLSVLHDALDECGYTVLVAVDGEQAAGGARGRRGGGGRATGVDRGTVGTSQTGADGADRPGAGALHAQHVLGDADLLLTGGEVGVRRVLRAAEPAPGGVGELQTAVVTVAGADVPTVARLAGGDAVPDVPADGRLHGDGGGRGLGRTGARDGGGADGGGREHQDTSRTTTGGAGLFGGSVLRGIAQRGSLS